MSNLKFLPKGIVRKSTKGGTRESNFDIRWANYTKQTEKYGAEKVNAFSFTAQAIKETGLGSSEFSACIARDANNTLVLAVMSSDNENATFFKSAKASAKAGKSKVVTLPTLVDELAKDGILDNTFQGSQYFDLVKIGEEDGITTYSFKQSEVPAKVYNPKEDNKTEEAAS